MIYVLTVVLGATAGLLAGMFGVGGGILFVPLFVALGLSQHEATATSLLAIIPTALAGTWRQRTYGNVRWKAAIILGLVSSFAAQAGVVVAEAYPEPFCGGSLLAFFLP
jgi:uncharacterized protein